MLSNHNGRATINNHNRFHCSFYSCSYLHHRHGHRQKRPLSLLTLPSSLSQCIEYPKMCYHRLFVYATCGHSYWGVLLSACPLLSLPSPTPNTPDLQLTCSHRMHHPFQTLRFHSLCISCSTERQRNLKALEMDDSNDTKTWQWKAEKIHESWEGLGDLRMNLRKKKMVEERPSPRSISPPRMG